MAGKRIIVFAAFALVGLVFALSARGGAEAQTYKPFTGYKLTTTTPGTSSNSELAFSIAAADLNYEDASMSILMPPDGFTATGPQALIGAKVGTLQASVAVGVAGGPCGQALTPFFDLYNASVNIGDALGPDDDDGDGFGDTEWILKDSTDPLWVVPKSQMNPLLEDYLEKYPWFLNTMLDPDGTGPLLPVQPRARFAGTTTVADFNVIVQFLVFNPGQMALITGSVYTQMGPAKGLPSYIVLDNPIGEGSSSPGAISDFCTPLKTTTTLYGVTQNNPNTGTGAGVTRQTNPGALKGILNSGTHMSYNYSLSERNVDGDAIENDLDPCRYNADPAGYNPRVVGGAGTGDADDDQLPDSCDPNDAQKLLDQDGDGYDNGQDNCPLVQNGCKDDTCHPTIYNINWDNQEDRDGGLGNADLGPRSDSLGDACDDTDDDGNEDGGAAGDCNDGIDNGGGDNIDGADADCVPSMDKADWPPAGTQPQNGIYYHALPWDAECVGAAGSDTDGDGYCDALENSLGSPINNGPETGAQCAIGDVVDDDGDGFFNDGCPYWGDYAETGAECADAISNDTPTPDAAEQLFGVKVNDGCPTIGTPESLVIDAAMTAASALPLPAAAQSCSDGIDNDLNNGVDSDNENLGCNPAHASYTGDTDRDGYLDGPDNCDTDWNPTQTNTDVIVNPPGDTLGDACDADDDNDGATTGIQYGRDTDEWKMGTDPLNDCAQVTGTLTPQHPAWSLDMNNDRILNLGSDVAQYAGKIGTTGGVAANWALRRLDQDGNGIINLGGDIAPYAGKIGPTPCTP